MEPLVSLPSLDAVPAGMRWPRDRSFPPDPDATPAQARAAERYRGMHPYPNARAFRQLLREDPNGRVILVEMPYRGSSRILRSVQAYMVDIDKSIEELDEGTITHILLYFYVPHLKGGYRADPVTAIMENNTRVALLRSDRSPIIDGKYLFTVAKVLRDPQHATGEMRLLLHSAMG